MKHEAKLKEMARQGDDSVKGLGFDPEQLKAEKRKDDIVAELQLVSDPVQRSAKELALINAGMQLPRGLRPDERMLLSNDNFLLYSRRLMQEKGKTISPSDYDLRGMQAPEMEPKAKMALRETFSKLDPAKENRIAGYMKAARDSGDPANYFRGKLLVSKYDEKRIDAEALREAQRRFNV